MLALLSSNGHAQKNNTLKKNEATGNLIFSIFGNAKIFGNKKKNEYSNVSGNVALPCLSELKFCHFAFDVVPDTFRLGTK